jgi:hypothetical protein
VITTTPVLLAIYDSLTQTIDELRGDKGIINNLRCELEDQLFQNRESSFSLTEEDFTLMDDMIDLWDQCSEKKTLYEQAQIQEFTHILQLFKDELFYLKCREEEIWKRVEDVSQQSCLVQNSASPITNLSEKQLFENSVKGKNDPSHAPAPYSGSGQDMGCGTGVVRHGSRGQVPLVEATAHDEFPSTNSSSSETTEGLPQQVSTTVSSSSVSTVSSNGEGSRGEIKDDNS